MALWTTVSAIVIFGTFAGAAPTVSYPINSQIPPIARVSEPYSYTFPQSTFTSSLTLSYSLLNAPDWLALDSDSRTLFGTPLTSDVGSGTITYVSFEIVASDGTGSATLETTLAVSTNAAPSIEIPVESQLPSFGFYSAPSTSLYHPSSPFKIKFDLATFSSDHGAHLTYYALTAEDTPLPSWVLFDENTLTFSGQTPEYASLIQPPQTFGIRLIASDIPNFAGASISFNIEVGVHLLAFSTTDLSVNATPGVNVTYTGLSDSLQIDGEVANSTSLVSVTAQTPPWLEFDNNTLSLSGTPPADATSSNVSLQALDVYGDRASTTVLVKLTMTMFLGPIQDINATIGSIFSYDLSPYISNISDLSLTARVYPATSWIDFDAHDLVLSGHIPTSVEPSSVNVTLTATSDSLESSSSESFRIAIVSPKSHPSASSSLFSTFTSATPAPSSTSVAKSKANPSISKSLSKGAIAAIVVPISIVFIALLICLFCYRKRRHDRSYVGGPSKEDISGPLGSNSSIVEPKFSPRLVAPLQLDTTGFSILDNGSSVYTSTDPNINAYNKRKSLRRSQTMSNAQTSHLPETQNITRARAYSENALNTTSNRNTWRNTQESEYPTLNSSSMTSDQRLTRNYSRKGHTRRSAYLFGNETRPRNSGMSQLGTQNLLGTSESTILNLDSNFSSSPLDNFSVLSGEWSRAVRPSGAGRQTRLAQNAERLRTHRKSTTRNLDFMATGMERRRSGVGHGGRESISSWDILNAPGNRRSIERGQAWKRDSGGLTRNSRTWKTVDTFDSDGQRHQSGTSTYSSASTDLMKLGAQAGAATNGKEMPGTRNTPISPPTAPYIWEQETGRSSRMSFSSNSTRPVSRRIGTSPFFGGGMSSVRRKARRSYADSPTVPEEVHMGDQLRGTQMNNDSLGIAYPNGYNSAREGTRQLRSYIQATFSKSRLKGSESMASVDSRFESVSGSMQELQLGTHQSQSQSRHTQLMELDRRELEAENREGYSDMLSSEFSAGSWESVGASTMSQPNYVRHGTSSPIPTVPTISSFSGYRGQSNNLTIPEDEHTPMDTNVSTNERESPVMGVLGPNARMVMGADRRPISVDNKRISSTKVKMGRHGESSGNVSPTKSSNRVGSVLDFSAYI